MPKGKKGIATGTITAFTLILGILALLYLLADKTGKYEAISKGKVIGERQNELYSAYADGEKALYYTDESAKISTKKALRQLALNGGSQKPECGKYKGYTLWKNGDKECMPSSKDATESYYKLLTMELMQYYEAYPYAKIPTKYSYTINGKTIIAIAEEGVTIKSSKQMDNFEYTAKPSFKDKIDYDFGIYDTLAKKAEEILQKCEGNELSTCSSQFDGQKTEDTEISIGCGETPQGNAIKICAKKGGIEYKFAISNNNLPTTGNEIETIKQKAEKHNVPTELALKVASIETGHTMEHLDQNGNAIKGDGGCSIGIMQINTCAHKQCQGKIEYDPNSKDICKGTESCSGKTIEDMECNIEAGIMHLKKGYEDYQEKEKKGIIDIAECYSCRGKYLGWEYALKFYNGCDCSDKNKYAEKAMETDVSEYINA